MKKKCEHKHRITYSSGTDYCINCGETIFLTKNRMDDTHKENLKQLLEMFNKYYSYKEEEK